MIEVEQKSEIWQHIRLFRLQSSGLKKTQENAERYYAEYPVFNCTGGYWCQKEDWNTYDNMNSLIAKYLG